MDRFHARFSKRIEDTVKQIESTLGDSVSEIWLFGSLARGDAKATSDIDIMISMKSNYPKQEVRNKLYELCEADDKGLTVDIRFCIAGKLTTYSKSFNSSVIKEKVVMKKYGD